MAKIDYKGIDDYANALGKLWKESEEIITRAVYEGAGVVADEIKAGLKKLPIDDRQGTSEDKLKGVTRKQKSDLIDAFGVAPIENDGDSINTRLGFDGYGSTPTKKYHNGVPNAMLMRSVESGNSFRKKTPVVRPAVTRARKNAEQKMGETLDKEIKERMR